MGESKRIWGGFTFSILVLMIIMLLSTNQQCAADVVKKNQSLSNQCDGSNKECLLSNDAEMEFLMDSEATKRVFEASASTSAGTHITDIAKQKYQVPCKGSYAACIARLTGELIDCRNPYSCGRQNQR